MHIQKENLTPSQQESLDKIAELEHNQWCYWSQEITKELDALSESLLDLLDIMRGIEDDKELPDNYLELLDLAESRLVNVRTKIQHWDRLWNTPYVQLTEQEKESNRVWARQVIKALTKGE